MELQSIIGRVKGILAQPREEWEIIKAETTSNKELILFYVLPFAAVAALITLFAIWASSYLGFALALRLAVLRLVNPIITIIIAAVVINELAETFDSTKQLNNAFKLVTYAYTPMLLVNIVISISPSLGFLWFLGLYGIYLFWVGLPVMMHTSEDKRLVYIIASMVVIILASVIITALFGMGRPGYYG